MTLPVATLHLPADLKNQINGRINISLLDACGVVNLTNPAVRRDWQMHHLASRAMQAMIATCGFEVRATGTYRTYDQQVSLFTARYQLQPIPKRPIKSWQGKNWYQKPGVAMAAVPGTSNHGLGLAIDFAEERDGDIEAESISAGFVAWLIKNAYTYGYSAEAQSEPWHWRYVAGDNIPAAVLNFENPPTPVPTQSKEEDVMFTVKVVGYNAAFLRTTNGDLIWISGADAPTMFAKYGPPVEVTNHTELAKLGSVVGEDPGQV